MPKKLHIAVAGGSCTGKSTLAAELFATLNDLGYDFDLVTEVSRRIKKDFGTCRNLFDRFFLWQIQQREERGSTARNGFITDAPLFQYFVHALQWAKTKRDILAVQELLRMSLDICDTYTLVVLHENPDEICYKKDGSRQDSKTRARARNALIRVFVQQHMHEKIVYVSGSLEHRVSCVLKKLHDMGFTKIPRHLRQK